MMAMVFLLAAFCHGERHPTGDRSPTASIANCIGSDERPGGVAIHYEAIGEGSGLDEEALRHGVPESQFCRPPAMFASVAGVLPAPSPAGPDAPVAVIIVIIIPVRETWAKKRKPISKKSIAGKPVPKGKSVARKSVARKSIAMEYCRAASECPGASDAGPSEAAKVPATKPASAKMPPTKAPSVAAAPMHGGRAQNRTGRDNRRSG